MAVILADVEGFSYKEIAEILDVPDRHRDESHPSRKKAAAEAVVGLRRRSTTCGRGSRRHDRGSERRRAWTVTTRSTGSTSTSTASSPSGGAGPSPATSTSARPAPTASLRGRAPPGRRRRSAARRCRRARCGADRRGARDRRSEPEPSSGDPPGLPVRAARAFYDAATRRSERGAMRARDRPSHAAHRWACVVALVGVVLGIYVIVDHTRRQVLVLLDRPAPRARPRRRADPRWRSATT